MRAPFRIALIVLLLAGAVACFAGAADGLVEWTQRHPLGERAEVQVDDALARATAGFLSVSAIKAGLAVLEGSELGMNFGAGVSIEFGDLVQSTYDYVDVAWRTLFLALATLLGLKLVLATAVEIAPFVLGLLLLSTALVVWTRDGGRFGRARDGGVDLLRTLPVVLLVLIYVLPGSILGAASLSDRLTRGMVDEANAELEAVETVLTPLHDPSGGWMDRMREARDSMERVVAQLRDRGEALFGSTLRLLVGYLFDCVIFPLGLVWLGTRVARGAVGWVLAESRWQRWARAGERSPVG